MLKGGNPFKEQELRTDEDAAPREAATGLLGRIAGIGSKSDGKVPRFMELTAKPFSKLDGETQAELSSLTRPSLICKPLLPMVVAYRIHCYKHLVKHELMMTKPQMDLVISQFARVFNNPDMLAALAVCWSLGAKQPAKHDDTQARMRTFITRLYPALYDADLHFDAIYPARSTPLRQALNMRRALALKSSLMGVKGCDIEEAVRTRFMAELKEEPKPKLASNKKDK